MTQLTPPMVTASPDARAVLDDPCTSYALKAALNASLMRDPLDALYDAELLRDLCRARAERVLNASRQEVSHAAI